jgi:hypothetical protein
MHHDEERWRSPSFCHSRSSRPQMHVVQHEYKNSLDRRCTGCLRPDAIRLQVVNSPKIPLHLLHPYTYATYSIQIKHQRYSETVVVQCCYQSIMFVDLEGRSCFRFWSGQKIRHLLGFTQGRVSTIPCHCHQGNLDLPPTKSCPLSVVPNW